MCTVSVVGVYHDVVRIERDMIRAVQDEGAVGELKDVSVRLGVDGGIDWGRCVFFFSSRRRHTRWNCDWSSDVCSSDLGREPVLSLTPSPGNVDVMVASELIEAGRAMTNGYVSPDRTTLIASTHRIYATIEKMQMADGRYEDDKVTAAASQLAKRAVLFDMRKLAQDSGTVINAVLFGAMAGSGVLPLAREACEGAIRKAGRGAEASLRGFAAGFEIAQGSRKAPDRPAKPKRATELAEIMRLADERLRDYQGEAYAVLYRKRLEAFRGVDAKVTATVARHLA